MNELTLEMFISAQRDFESSQFHILSGLQKIRRDFTRNRIYPPLAELIELYQTLKRITQSGDGILKELPKSIAKIDLKEKRIVYEPLELDRSHMQMIGELVRWALPHIQEAIEEGRTIFNFVEENMKVEEVGIVPSYIEEGYLLLPELAGDRLHVIRYEISIFSSADQQYRNLKTTSVSVLPLSTLNMSAQSIKLDLMRQHRDLPNPATYLFSTDLDFPFNETILPVAKRKLLRQIYS